MKTIFTSFTILILSSSVFASDFRSPASLTVIAANKAAIVVVVDDQRYDLGTHSIMISGLDACNHQLTVYQENSSSLNCAEKANNILFNSAVELQPGTNLKISIDADGIVTMNEIKFKRREMNDGWQGANFNQNNDFDIAGTDSKAISPVDFSRVLWAVGKESSEANRMKSAEQIIYSNFLTANQVKQLLQLFCSDNNRLELARLAFAKTVDQSDYYVVNNSFKANINTEELSRCNLTGTK